MGSAKDTSCDFLLYCKDEKYAESIRQWQGCPTVAVTPKGRIFLGWYSGGLREPHMDNYNLMVYSDDSGKTWSEPVVIIPSNKEHCIQALDIQLWISPEGKLYLFWVQNNTIKSEEQCYHWVDGYIFADFHHAQWLAVCDNPDADVLEFSEPRYIDNGFLRCKPTVLSDGRWFCCNYDQITDCYGFSISNDNGKTFERHYGAKKIETPFDESMVYERKDGSLHMFARNKEGYIAETVSDDGGKTWSETKLTDIPSPNTRFYVSRTPSGRILLVNNDRSDDRANMTVYLSEDDGNTFAYKKCVYEQKSSYPDVDFYDGKVYLTFDHERLGAKEILFCAFTEDDIINDNEIEIKIVSKP